MVDKVSLGGIQPLLIVALSPKMEGFTTIIWRQTVNTRAKAHIATAFRFALRHLTFGLAFPTKPLGHSPIAVIGVA